MSDFSIKPPGVPGVGAEQAQPAVSPREGVDGDGAKVFELTPAAATPEATPSSRSAAVEPSALVQRIHAGEIDVDRAVEILVDQALAAQPIVSEALRQEVRRALTELVREDPTLSTLASAMRR
jgi:hypothetical protein